jgi:hypothetical protein
MRNLGLIVYEVLRKYLSNIKTGLSCFFFRRFIHNLPLISHLKVVAEEYRYV